MKIQIIRCKGGWYFRFKARNGRILSHSEVYKSKAMAEHGADVIVSDIARGLYSWEEC